MVSDIPIHGFCDEAFLPLKEAFIQNFADGTEVGACLAATHQGKTVVDLWAGYADIKQTRPWEEDTIACVFSTTKIFTVVCTLMAVDRGLLELDRPVAEYWPEFGAHGKDRITVRDAMTHRALVPSFANPKPYSVAHDWELMTRLIADEKPWFEPGTFCYHPITYGHILGELVRRVTGVDFQEFFVRELAEPLQADFQIGLTDVEEQNRVATLKYTMHPPEEIDPFMTRVMMGIHPSDPTRDEWRDWDRRSAVIPASTGHGNARGIVKLGNMLAMGGTLDGRTFLSSQIIDEARTEQCHQVCPLMGDIRFGLGFGLDGVFFPAPTPNSFHWGGYGGSWCFMDPQTRTSVSYAMNHCIAGPKVDDTRRIRFWQAFGQVDV